MLSALSTSDAVALYRYYADRYHLVYRTQRLTDVRVPGYEGTLDLLYAEQAQ